MIISIIVAASTNNAIGNKNKLLWKLPNDLKFFKNITWGNVVAMGRKTFESLGNKPLPGRFNIIITRQLGWNADGVSVAHSLNEAIQLAKLHQYKEIFIAGGGEIYKEAITKANQIYITRVHAKLDGDTFFPEIKINKWQIISDVEFAADAKHAFAYSFQLWKPK